MWAGISAPAGAKVPGANGRIAFDGPDPVTGASATWIVNADGANLTELPLGVGNAVPRWSPDGSRLLIGTFDDHGRPAIVNPDGTGLTILTVPGLPAFMDVGPCVWIPPDGSRILCSSRNFATSDHSLDGIYSMTSSGADIVRLTVNPYPPSDPFGGGDLVGDVSPDGQQFVFMRARPDPGHPPGREQSGALFVENIDGSGLHQITNYGLPNSHDDGYESWSPDGSKILFGSNNGGLFTIHPDGADLAAVPIRAAGGQTGARAPGWSPDGTRIVCRLFLSSAGRADIYTLRADGSDLTRLTTDNFVDDPDWGPSS